MQELLSAIDIQPSTLYVMLGAIVVAYVLIRFLAVPLKYLWYVTGILAKGAAILLIFNMVSIAFNYILPFNLVTSFLVGMLGVPGIILVMAVNHFLG